VKLLRNALGAVVVSLLAALAVAAFTAPAMADPAGAVSPGTAGTQSFLMGCYRPSTTPAPSTGQQMAVSCDASGNLVITSATTPTAVSTTDKGGTITLGGTAQAAIALNASRKAWCIQNGPAESETLYVRVNGTASATTGVALSPGQQACSPPGLVDTAAVSVFAATTSHRWYGSEAQ
jgi:hypothetical protein